MSTYTAYLRVRHSSIDPDAITSALGLNPVHAWAAGSPRDGGTETGVRGHHAETYWLAPLGNEGWQRAMAGVATDPTRSVWPSSKALPLEGFLLGQSRLLMQNKEFFARLKAEGASVELSVTLDPDEQFSLELPPGLLRALADLNIGVSIELATETEAETEAEPQA